MPVLFKSFSQVDSSVSRKRQGTGLGLVICKHLVDQMGGSIWVTSELGSGSTFSFSIPLARQHQSEDEIIDRNRAYYNVPKGLVTHLSRTELENRTSRSKSDIPFLRKPKTRRIPATSPLQILIAEDNKINQRLISKILTKHGYSSYITANDGRDCIEKLNDQAIKRIHVHLILMDIQMPNMDGMESTQLIRSQYPRDKQPYIIALTANAYDEDKTKCFEAGMDGFLSKPFDPADLKRIIEMIVEWGQRE
jgi:CheY-like chemotaxis protein